MAAELPLTFPGFALVFLFPFLATARISDALLGACAHPEALDTFQAVRKRGEVPDVILYNALIDRCAKGKEPLRALVVFEEMRFQGVAPNLITYNALIGACAKGNQPERALEIFEGMRKQGVTPSLTTYRILIGTCRKANQPEQALHLLQEMQLQGVVPDASTYDTVIKACEEGNQPELAEEVLRAMREQGLVPSLATFNSVISSLAKGGQFERALEVLRAMRQQGIVPDVITYNALISGCPSPQRALAMIRELKQEEVRIDVNPKEGLAMNGYRRGSIPKVFLAMRDQGEGSRPNAQRMNIFVAALLGLLAGSGVTLGFAFRVRHSYHGKAVQFLDE
jgi:pentatricopeptide repeat protein